MDNNERYSIISKFGPAKAAMLGVYSSTTTADILSWAYGSLFRLVSSTRDVNDAIVTANIVWPDGITGVFTTDVASVEFPGAIDAWHATYTSVPAKIITQPVVTRDVSGAVTAQPEIVITGSTE